MDALRIETRLEESDEPLQDVVRRTVSEILGERGYVTEDDIRTGLQLSGHDESPERLLRGFERMALHEGLAIVFGMPAEASGTIYYLDEERAIAELATAYRPWLVRFTSEREEPALEHYFAGWRPQPRDRAKAAARAALEDACDEFGYILRSEAQHALGVTGIGYVRAGPYVPESLEPGYATLKEALAVAHELPVGAVKHKEGRSRLLYTDEERMLDRVREEHVIVRAQMKPF